MSDLRAIYEDAPYFIEDALVYRLAWALEAIRVRSFANGENLFGDTPCLVVSGIEAGTLSMPEAMLIQSGLTSRIAASKVIEDCPGQFSNMHDLRVWLFSDIVVEATKSENWPTKETKHLWLEYVENNRNLKEIRWDIIEKNFTFSSTKPMIEGDSVFIWQAPDHKTISVFTPQLEEICKLENSFKEWATPWAIGRIVDKTTVSMRYIGPVPR